MTSNTGTSGAKSRFETSHQATVARPAIRAGTAQGARAVNTEALEFADLHEIHDSLDIKLRWYGWTWAKIGPFRPRGAKVLVDLIADGRVACRIAADRRTGAVQLANGPRPSCLEPVNQPFSRRFLC